MWHWSTLGGGTVVIGPTWWTRGALERWCENNFETRDVEHVEDEVIATATPEQQERFAELVAADKEASEWERQHPFPL